MKLNEKQKEFLDKACMSKFGVDFDTMYKNMESSEELRQKAKIEAKRLRQLKKEAKKQLKNK